MGALKGSIAVRRYAVVDPLPDEVHRRFEKGLRAHAFLPLDPAGETDRASGWVTILDGDDADLRGDKVFFDGAGGTELRVTLRSDVLQAPGGEVRRQVNQRAQAMEAEEKRTLSRRERSTLKEEVTRALKLRAFPRVKLVDMVWELEGGRVYFWAQSKAANELFVDLFVKSFGLKLEVDGPARWARNGAGVDDKLVARLEPTKELWLGFEGVRPLPGDDAGEAA